MALILVGLFSGLLVVLLLRLLIGDLERIWVFVLIGVIRVVCLWFDCLVKHEDWGLVCIDVLV